MALIGYVNKQKGPTAYLAVPRKSRFQSSFVGKAKPNFALPALTA